MDWSGHDGTATALRYGAMAEHVARLSPSYQVLCAGVADDAAVIGRLDTLPVPKRQPNLLLAAVRYLGGPIDSWDRFRAFVLDGWDEVAAVISARRTQTNEPRRCAALLPVLASLPQPLVLLEVGASAGLCLYPDRYAYRYDGGAVLGSSDVVLECATSGDVPLPGRRPDVVWRGGLDLNPLDPTDDDDVRWLEALIWPEEHERFGLLRGAIEIARREPAVIARGDLTRDVVGRAAQAPPDATLVVYHSAVLAYLDDVGRAAFRAQLADIATTRPMVWLANEAPGVLGGASAGAPGAPAPRPDDFVLCRDGVALAYTGSHGASLDWLPGHVG